MVGCNLDARTEPSDSHIVFTMSILPVKWSSCIYLHFKTLQKKFVRDASVTSSNLKNHIECKCTEQTSRISRHGIGFSAGGDRGELGIE